MSRFLLFIFVLFVCITALNTCQHDFPNKPKQPNQVAPDTTTHEYGWESFNIGDGFLYDVSAVSPDFVIIVGDLEPMVDRNLFINSYIWNGYNLQQLCLHINPYDSLTINPRPIPTMPINSVWAFRRDNIWYTCSVGAAVHMTITNSDTNIKNYGYGYRSDIAASFGGYMWAKDTSEIYFGNWEGIMYKYKSGTWTPITPATHGGNMDDLWGFDSENIWALSVSSTNYEHTLFRYNGYEWKLLWLAGEPSLSDSVFFGAPVCFWGANDDDSLWISGLYLGRMKKDGTGKITALKSFYQYGFRRIRGSAKNNVFFVGGDGRIVHFNGASFHDYDLFKGKDYEFRALAVLENDVYIVGGNKFVHGKRKPTR